MVTAITLNVDALGHRAGCHRVARSAEAASKQFTEVGDAVDAGVPMSRLTATDGGGTVSRRRNRPISDLRRNDEARHAEAVAITAGSSCGAVSRRPAQAAAGRDIVADEAKVCVDDNSIQQYRRPHWRCRRICRSVSRNALKNAGFVGGRMVRAVSSRLFVGTNCVRAGGSVNRGFCRNCRSKLFPDGPESLLPRLSPRPGLFRAAGGASTGALKPCAAVWLPVSNSAVNDDLRPFDRRNCDAAVIDTAGVKPPSAAMRAL